MGTAFNSFDRPAQENALFTATSEAAPTPTNEVLPAWVDIKIAHGGNVTGYAEPVDFLGRRFVSVKLYNERLSDPIVTMAVNPDHIQAMAVLTESKARNLNQSRLDAVMGTAGKCNCDKCRAMRAEGVQTLHVSSLGEVLEKMFKNME